jgi:two-component system, LuxR family, response regulator FixJ
MDFKKTDDAPAAIAMGDDNVANSQAVRSFLARFLRLQGCDARTFIQAQSYLSAISLRSPARLLLDVEVRNGSAREWLESLDDQAFRALILLVVVRSNVRLSIRCLNNGKIEKVRRTFAPASLRATSAAGAKRQQEALSWLPQFPGFKNLTRREYEVLVKILAGASSKETARSLGVSPRTIEVHRSHIMKKLHTRNMVELLHAVLRLDPPAGGQAAARAK